MTAPLILDSYPASSSIGIPIGDSITVTFDQEIDESSVNSGTFVVGAPANDTVFGPGLEPLSQQFSEDRDDILTPPEFGGYIEGTITFSRVDASGSIVDDSEVDYTGARNLWRSVAIFTPKQPLRPNVEYTVILAGDEDQTNDFDSGIRSRTVFDAQPISVIGTGTPIFSGGYTSSTTRTYVLEITGAGVTGAATYDWWNQTSPLVVYSGQTTTGNRELEDGLVVSFSIDGSFAVGDRWTVVVVPYETLANNYSWTFSTGTGSVLTPPTTGSTSGIDAVGYTSFGSLRVVSIEPVHQATNLDPNSVTEIVITFNKDVDEDTVIDSNITIWSEPINGKKYNTDIQYAGTIAKILSVSGRTIIAQIT